MRRRGRLGISKDENGHGSDRPWVYFMIDCFFLVTQFFVLTFHVHSDEPLLPQKLVGGRGPGPKFSERTLIVHVSRTAGNAIYTTMQQKFDLPALTQMLNRSKDAIVKVSYDPEVSFGDVIAVFNACQSTGNKCGIAPIHE